MDEIMKYKTFVDNGNFSREKENFSYTLFENLDFINELPPISFFRSDFRGARFQSISFFHNNFDRADFISAVFENCIFREVDIAACEIKNCYFSNSKFTLNKYANTSIQECTFENCIFENEIFLVNMKNCRFINCTLKDNTFERSTTEKLFFSGCEIINNDLATMHAENYSFKSCTLRNVSFGISYIFGYLFYKTDISDLYILYRGDKVQINTDNLSEYITTLWQDQRFYEFINANLFLLKKSEEVPKIFTNSLNQLAKSNNTMRRLEISNLLEMFSFYILNNQLPYKLVCEVMNILNDFNWKSFPFDEQMLYLPICKKIEMTVSNFQYDDNFINSAEGTTLFLTFTCQTDSYEESLKTTSDFLDELHEKLAMDKNYSLVMSKKGSWVLTFVVASTIGLMLPKMINDYANLCINFSARKDIMKILKSEYKNLSSKDTQIRLDSINTMVEIACKAGIINQKFETIELTEIFKKLVTKIDIMP